VIEQNGEKSAILKQFPNLKN